jgi:hypothetical protein
MSGLDILLGKHYVFVCLFFVVDGGESFLYFSAEQDFHKTLNLMKFHFNDSDSRQ